MDTGKPELAAGEVPQEVPARPPGRLEWPAFVKVYVTLVPLLGLLVLAFVRLPQDRLGLALFAAMAALAELTSVELFMSSRSRLTVSTIIAFAAILVFSPLAGALIQVAAGAMTIVTTTFLQQSRLEHRASGLQRATFNTGMLVLASACAGWVYELSGGVSGSALLLSAVIPLILAVAAGVLANIVLLIGVIALQNEQSPLEIWNRDFQWALPQEVVGSVIGGGLLALAYQSFGVLGLPVFFLPILSIGYSFRLYVSKTKVYVNQLEEMNRTLDKANLGLLETLGAVIDAYDIYTYGHSAQVADYAGALAGQMELSKEERAVIVKAALVHDIGKIGIVESIIGKQGPLTVEEMEIMKKHPIIGADIIRRMDSMQALVPLVRHHHERWDGAGYPAGLAGEEIPLGARVLALADALAAISSDRPYRTSRGIKELKAEIIHSSGTHFDPQVVEAFRALIELQGDAFIKNSAAAVDRTIIMDPTGKASLGRRYLKKGMLNEDWTP